MADALVIILLVVGTVALIGVLGVFIQRSGGSAQAGRALDEMATSPISAAAIGDRVRLRGTVAQRDGGVVARYSGDEAIGVHLTMSHHSRGESRRWATEDQCKGFWLSDESGRARVEVDGAVQLLLGRADDVADVAGSDMPEWMRPIWQRNGLTLVGDPTDDSQFEVDEVLLRDGDEVDVMGLVTGIDDVDGRPEVTIGADPDHGIVVRPPTGGGSVGRLG